MGENDLARAVSESILLHHLDSGSGEKAPGRVVLKVDREAIDERLMVFHQPRSIESEYFRFLKSRIEQHFDARDDGQKSRAILVTGPNLGAGKTVCAINLALAFARTHGSQTLLVDADSRRGTSRQYMGIRNDHLPGLTDVLNLQARAGSCLLNTGMFDMAYFPSGRFSETFLDNLKGQELGTLMRNLKSRFRYIIIDAPPAFPMPEPSILAHHCDGVFIVLRAGRDGNEDLVQAMEALEGAPIMGVILNGVKRTPGQRYGAYGYYGKGSKAKGD